jgi:hypothetical protein
MSIQVKKPHPALKHGGYSATNILPGEDSTAFEKLQRGLIAELSPTGVLEDDIVATITRLVWRKQNLAPVRRADLARESELGRLLEDLGVEARLDALIDKCLKRLLFVRGLKSLPTASSSAPPQPIPEPQRIPGPTKAA